MATPSFSIQVTTEADAVVVSVAGEIDMATGPTVWDAVEAAMAALAGRALVLDLAGTTFMDSTGLGLIIRASGLYGPDRVAVRSPQPRVLALLDLTGMRKHITLLDVDDTDADDVQAT